MNDGVNQPGAIAAAALLTGVGALIPNTMPKLVGIFADWHGYDSTQLGVLASAFMGGLWLTTVALMFLVRRIDWRVAARILCLVQIAGLVLTTRVEGYLSLAGFFFLSGIGAGGVFGIATTSLADTRQPDRNIGLATLAQVGAGALALFVLSALVMPMWGSAVAVLTLALASSLGLVLTLFIARRGAETRTDAGSDPANVSAPIVGLIGIVLLFLGIFGIWSFLERIGTEAGLSPQFVGAVVSGALVAGAVGTLVPVWLGDRRGRRGPILIASLMLIASILVLGSEVGKVTFTLAALTFNFAWTVAIIYQCGGVAAADTTGRFAAGIPQALALGGFIGPLLTGAMKAQLGLPGLTAVAVLSVLASLSLAMWVASRPASFRSG